MLMVGRERRAAAYAQECYNHDSDTNVKATNCDFFYNSTIGYGVQEDKCPFDRTDICVDGYQPGSAITFDTNWVNSGVLGINEELMHKFRRKTTCAPLSAERPFVQHFTNSGTGESGYKYFYGSLYDTRNCSDEVHAPPTVLSEYTMRITGHPFDWQAPVYKVNTYATSLLDPTCDFYQPSPDLQAPGLLPHRSRTLSLIFVTALRILYTKRSNDPVFPADKAFQYPGDKGFYYYNSQPKARAFACIDETIFCAPSGSPCWHANDAIPAGGSNTSSYWFLKYALKSSNTYDAIKLRLGSGLLAQQRVGQSRSMPLADNHWQLEAEHLFKTSLARAQFDAWSIASAEDHDNPTYTDTLPDEARGNMCGLFKFQASGYINIRILPFVWLMLAWPLMLILSIELRTYEKLGKVAMSEVRRKSKQSVRSSPDATTTTTDLATAVTDSTTPDHPQEVVDSNATATPTPQRPGTASSTTPLIAASSASASSDANHNYGTSSTLSSTPSDRSSETDKSEWSPLLIHGPAVLSVWMYKKMRSERVDARDSGDTV
ncbi:uncharacterized protein J4E79_003960 [Alternaria viburni]|uniref:uncharacterized protein n=1 Tax=Alternaria viburni TaxID=566460 RepID=UPI0020C412AE|nr:uncharacterized protein J4E79_003960 [Alternaria viburni]KAI4662651.1 hypothetical protein J4E79_003960 [Alternaria viburni]